MPVEIERAKSGRRGDQESPLVEAFVRYVVVFDFLDGTHGGLVESPVEDAAQEHPSVRF